MRIILAIAFCTLIVATLPPAYADWTLVGAAAKCDEKEGLTIAATVDGSEGIFKVPPEEGFYPLPDGENKIECTVGGAHVSASIAVFPPSATHCMGSGMVMMKRFAIGTVPVVQAHRPFLWHCYSDPSGGPQPLFIGVSASWKDDRFVVKKCYASDWDDSRGYSAVECTAEDPGRFRASFDCAKASTKVENLVCNDQNLSRLDQILFASYRYAMRFQKTEAPLRRSQRLWLEKQRDSCANQSCLQRAYEKRIKELRALTPKTDSNQMGNY